MMSDATVAAIVPAYNEGPRIKLVLDALTACPDISEVIVVDDGSRESLEWVRNDYPSVHLLRHEHNLGKAAAMETGVNASSADYIFFCDADLVGFLPAHASAMIRPVVSGAYRMYVGLRDNPEQRAVFLIALNTGERCISKADWTSLPRFYKKRFRIETGLNFFVKKHRGKLGYTVFPYRQTLREEKYGTWVGFKTRVSLSFDVFCAWLYIVFFDVWRR